MSSLWVNFIVPPLLLAPSSQERYVLPNNAEDSRYKTCVRRWAKRWALGCEKFPPGPTWLLLRKRDPSFSPYLYSYFLWFIYPLTLWFTRCQNASTPFPTSIINKTPKISFTAHTAKSFPEFLISPTTSLVLHSLCAESWKWSSFPKTRASETVCIN